MNFIEQQSMLIITHSGTAKSLAIEAIQEAKQGNIEEANKLIEESEKEVALANQAHHDTLVESTKDDFNVTLLLAHAEDQMLTSETTIILSREIIELYERLNSN